MEGLRYPQRIELRLKLKKRILKNGCWEFTGTLDRYGYGQISYQGKITKVHRLSWELKNKKLSTKCILHTCDNRKCFNPKHLYEGDKKQNSIDAVYRMRLFNQRKTHCSNNHEFNDKNTRMYGKRRICRVCDKLRKAAEWKV